MQKAYEVKRITGRMPAAEGRHWTRRSTSQRPSGGETWGQVSARPLRRHWSHEWSWTSSLWNYEPRHLCCLSTQFLALCFGSLSKRMLSVREELLLLLFEDGENEAKRDEVFRKWKDGERLSKGMPLCWKRWNATESHGLNTGAYQRTQERDGEYLSLRASSQTCDPVTATANGMKGTEELCSYLFYIIPLVIPV